MQIVAKRVTGNGESQEVYVQQITVSGLNDAELSNVCDAIWEQLKGKGLNVQFRDDAIPEEVKTQIYEGLFIEA